MFCLTPTVLVCVLVLTASYSLNIPPAPVRSVNICTIPKVTTSAYRYTASSANRAYEHHGSDGNRQSQRSRQIKRHSRPTRIHGSSSSDAQGSLQLFQSVRDRLQTSLTMMRRGDNVAQAGGIWLLQASCQASTDSSLHPKELDVSIRSYIKPHRHLAG